VVTSRYSMCAAFARDSIVTKFSCNVDSHNVDSELKLRFSRSDMLLYGFLNNLIANNISVSMSVARKVTA